MTTLEYIKTYYEYKWSAPETIYGSMIFAADIIVCSLVYATMMRFKYPTQEPFLVVIPIFLLISFWDGYLMLAILAQHASYAYLHHTEMAMMRMREKTDELNRTMQIVYIRILIADINPWKL